MLIVSIDWLNFQIKYCRDITDQELEKCEKDCIDLKGTDSFNEILDHVLQLEGETMKIINKIVKHNLYILAHTGCGFDSYVFFIILPQWRTFVISFKNGSGKVSPTIFNGDVDKEKKIPQYVHFRCGRVHTNSSLRIKGISFNL